MQVTSISAFRASIKQYYDEVLPNGWTPVADHVQ